LVFVISHQPSVAQMLPPPSVDASLRGVDPLSAVDPLSGVDPASLPLS
jgi:hypothetical protein